MSADITFHYPPELFNLLVDALPALNRSKKDVLLFFRGAGVTDDLTRDLAARLRADRDSIGKHEIARTVLERLNEKGESTLRERRELLRRVVEFTNFDACWPEDHMKAKGYVSSIRDIVNQKDAFTRMNQAREDERKARLAVIDEASRSTREKAAKIDAAKRDFYALFGSSLTPQQRGKQLEAALNDVFKAYGISVTEAFHLVGDGGEGIVEQIDGAIEHGGALYFVEMKWYASPVGTAEISQHLVRLMGRAEARGLFISASDFTQPAIHTAREFLVHKLIALCHLEELVRMLDSQHELTDLIRQKAQAALLHKNPYFRPLDTNPS